MQQMTKPVKRSNIRVQLGMIYYGALRQLLWIKKSKLFAKKQDTSTLPHLCVEHKTVLLRQLKDVDMWLQQNKIVNLKIATKKLNGIIIRPGEIFSYWYLIGKPTKAKGYKQGMVLQSGKFKSGVGGGLCQLSNLIFWLTAHTPLSVIERHRHGYDVFPDSNRIQPFGSGATCFYPHGDLMIQNNTEHTYQLFVYVDEEYLHGQWRVSVPSEYKYKVVEKNHTMSAEYWGGYSRHNELYKQKLNLQDEVLEEELIVKNSAIMMYSPFLENKQSP